MATHRVTLIVDWSYLGEPMLPLTPVRTHRRLDGRWELEFDADGESFDATAGRLWGEAAACGLRVLGVGSASADRLDQRAG